MRGESECERGHYLSHISTIIHSTTVCEYLCTVTMGALELCKMMCSAFLVSLVIFLIILAGALKNDWIILVILVPLLLTPLPLLILKCCSSDNWGSTPKGAHWAEFMSGAPAVLDARARRSS